MKIKRRTSYLSFSPHPCFSLSGSDQSRSHSNPESGTSVGRTICIQIRTGKERKGKERKGKERKEKGKGKERERKRKGKEREKKGKGKRKEVFC